jgi:hypothetical protein
LAALRKEGPGLLLQPLQHHRPIRIDGSLALSWRFGSDEAIEAMAMQWLYQQPTEFLDKAIRRLGVAMGCPPECPLPLHNNQKTSFI